ncbi:alcohol dehydrogenase catalytic domain-containing protein [Janthinobacterium sp. GB4P2]|uniref:alcohol dehydrogenase catalytic domain-containing protein n=1 Tax=Janthinobacterium sp. GB4P2 TaxID=3424189 RepID=UPI003F2552AB
MPDPAILGIDLAGTVAAVGEGVTTFHVGTTVYGMAGGIGGIQGSLAEYGVFDAALLAPMPPGLSLREAAALPLVFITAWEGLVDRAHVQAGDTMLVHGGAGGVGHMAVQLAVSLGVFTLLPLLSGLGHARHGAILREANKLIEAGKLHIRLDARRLTLRTAHDAHAAHIDGSARGKLVVDVAA